MQLHEALRLWRERLEMSRLDAAVALGIPPRTYEAWEQGRRLPEQPGPVWAVLRYSVGIVPDAPKKRGKSKSRSKH